MVDGEWDENEMRCCADDETEVFCAYSNETRATSTLYIVQHGPYVTELLKVSPHQSPAIFNRFCFMEQNKKLELVRTKLKSSYGEVLLGHLDCTNWTALKELL